MATTRLWLRPVSRLPVRCPPLLQQLRRVRARARSWGAAGDAGGSQQGRQRSTRRPCEPQAAVAPPASADRKPAIEPKLFRARMSGRRRTIRRPRRGWTPSWLGSSGLAASCRRMVRPPRNCASLAPAARRGRHFCRVALAAAVPRRSPQLGRGLFWPLRVCGSDAVRTTDG